MSGNNCYIIMSHSFVPNSESDVDIDELYIDHKRSSVITKDNEITLDATQLMILTLLLN